MSKEKNAATNEEKKPGETAYEARRSGGPGIKDRKETGGSQNKPSGKTGGNAPSGGPGIK